MNNLVDF